MLTTFLLCSWTEREPFGVATFVSCQLPVLLANGPIPADMVVNENSRLMLANN